MIVYLVYLRVPANIYANSLFRVFLPNARDYKLHEDGYYVGLYAWSNKKKYVKKFLEYRNSENYLVKTMKLDEDEDASFAEGFAERNYKIHIEKHRIITSGFTHGVSADEIREDDFSDKWAPIYMTFDEYVNVTEYLDENMGESGIDTPINYRIFSDDMINALDITGYTTNYDLLVGDNSTARDVASHQLSFELTVCGHKMPSFYGVEIVGFTLFYRYPIFGDRLSDMMIHYLVKGGQR